MSLLALALALASGAWGASTDTAYELPVTTLTPVVRYKAEDVALDRSSGTLDLSGHVWVKEEDWVLKSERVHLDMKSRHATASGYVLVETEGSALWGEEGDFDLREHSGTLRHANGGYSPWYIQAKSLMFKKGEAHDYRSVNLTTCNYVPEPHYYMHASRLKVKPKKWMMATNMVVFLGDVPVFYLPFFYSPLEGWRQFGTHFSFGFSGHNGFEIKSTTYYRFSPYFYGRLYLDAFTAQGLGTGGELDYRHDKEARGSLYGYQIKEGGASERRWTVLGNYFQNAGAYSIQGRLQMLSDPQFNNDYFRTNFFQVTPDLHNSFALTRATRWLTYRLSGERVDVFSGSRFLRQRQSLPRLDVNTVGFGLPGGLTLSGGNYVDRQYLASDAFEHLEAQTSWHLSRSFGLVRNLSLVPRVVVSETWRSEAFSSTSSARLQDVTTARYGGGVLLRWAGTRSHLDLDYSKNMRGAAGSLRRDRGAFDLGVETDNLSLTHFWRPSRWAYTRVGTSYDFRALPAFGLTGSQRWAPIRTEASFTPSKDWSFSAVNVYSVAPGTRTLTLQADFGDPLGDRVGLGLFTSFDGRLLISNTASYGKGSWRLIAALRYELDTPAGGLEVYDKMLALEKTFHDFETYWQVRERRHDAEIGFRVNLRYTYDQAAASANLNAEREWYPWRKGPPVER